MSEDYKFGELEDGFVLSKEEFSESLTPVAVVSVYPCRVRSSYEQERLVSFLTLLLLAKREFDCYGNSNEWSKKYERER